MMHLPHIVNGFTFLMIITGIGAFFSWVFAGMSVSDNESYKGWAVFLAVLISLVFLVSGFFSFALR